MLTAEHHEGGVITKPTCLVDAPSLKGLVAIGRLPCPTQTQRSGQCIGPLTGQGEIKVFAPRCLRRSRLRKSLHIIGSDESLVAQILGIEQPGIDGETRRRAVGRARSIRWSERQYLPHPDSVASQRMQPASSSSTERAAHRCSGKSGWMQKNTNPAT